ncbi:phospholipase D family protein [Primorskyibacter flagellatus]|uniref:Phospholipase D n=1 Tax=Primorskyibacter flagellatus TaxID=1387277 RepID=A0A1W2ASN6_9RHOB|nr:phospholipase D family protein [Primorskyibacter flagellatus]SMC63716.1 Phosphatidylserine/phosphatidylglycerophosphate/cardiolipin synthase [Primorskyibacter flagellatus]
MAEITPLITAAEGFPALERLALSAEQEYVMSFRIFDPETRTRSPEAKKLGLNTWGDILEHLASNGVALRIVLSDFDPIFTDDLHEQAWQAARLLEKRLKGDVHLTCAPHGQMAGKLWHLLMRRGIAAKLREWRERPAEDLTPVEQAILAATPHLRPVTIHQKFAVADSARAVIGGLDVNERRWDDKSHDLPSDETWHDVSMRITGPFCTILRAHFTDTWNEALACGAPVLLGEEAPEEAKEPASSDNIRLVRTLSRPCQGPTVLGPLPNVTEHEETLVQLFEDARDYVYIETQFFRHAPIAKALASAGSARDDLQLIIVMPTEPDRILFDGDRSWNARHAQSLQISALDQLRKAFGDRLMMLSPAKTETAPKGADGRINGAGPIYVHSKVLLIDDAVGMVGSANLNGRSLRWDTEASVLFRDPQAVRHTRERLANKWLGDGHGLDTTCAADWRSYAEKNAKISPEDRRGFLLPYPYERNKRFARLMPLFPDDMF